MKKEVLNLKENKNGITLIALVITIIVLLILAGVTIQTLTGDNGLISKAGEAKEKNKESEVCEQIKLAYQEYQMEQFTGNTEEIGNYIKNSLNTTYGNDSVTDVTKTGNIFMVIFSDGRIYTYNISKGKATDLTNTTNIAKSDKKADSFVGCYADIDADGIVDGVIFADLLTGSKQDTQQWTNSDGEYTIPKLSAESLKDYYISKESHKWANTQDPKPVLSPKGTGADRFYIMSLTDFATSEYTTFYWYRNAQAKMNPLITSNDFGEGKENTRKMIAKWNAAGTSEGYPNSPQDNQDIWKHIQEKYNEGWFLPSRAELGAFVNELEITSSNFNSTYKLSNTYFPSSQRVNYQVWYARLNVGKMDGISLGLTNAVRLATTF